MPCDCSAIGLDEVFDERTARHDVRRFLKRGLARRARRLLAAIERTGPVAGVESLEIGAGAGGLTITLLERGARRATTVDASPAFAAAARSLAQQRGVADRMHILTGDFAAEPEVAEPADIVVLDRVICCYPDLAALLRPAAGRARRSIALSYPAGLWWARLLVRGANLGLGLMRRRFRMRFHSPDRVRAILAEAGFVPVEVNRAYMWELLVATRA